MEWLTKSIDLLKASGWQTAMIAAAAALFLYLSKADILPPLDPRWIELVVWAVLLVCAALAAASVGSAIQRGVGHLWTLWKRRRARVRAKAAFVRDIPYLSDKERQILGYLREKKRKTFDVDQNGGYANTLLGKRHVLFIAQPGQALDPDRMPVTVAEHVWEVLQERPGDFPYTPEYSTDGPPKQRVEVSPWRIPWMLR